LTRRFLASALLASLTILAALAAAGCAKNHRIAIESNTCWLAKIDRQAAATSEDCGNATFRVAGDIHCVVLTNLTDTGYVRVRIDEGQWLESTAPRGSVETCR
jgi:hypothetical protein